MNRIALIAFFAAVVVACQPKKQDEQAGADTTATPAAATETANQLTDQQKAEGWKLLFDGQTMNGWHVYKNGENDSWEASEGTLHCKPFVENGVNKRADITTNEQFENFELAFDWKISAQGNSGVIYRVSEEFNEPFGSGPEYQVIDDEGYPGDLKDWQLSGADYDMYPPTAKVVRPAGEWNQGRIVVNGIHVEHWLNGTKVAEYEFHSDDWKKRLAESKWKDFPGYGLTKKGFIDLQDHGNEAWYRNIMIKTL